MLYNLIIHPSKTSLRYAIFNKKDFSIEDIGYFLMDKALSDIVSDLKKEIGFYEFDQIVFVAPYNESIIRTLNINKVEKKYIKMVIESEYGEQQFDSDQYYWDYQIISEKDDSFNLLAASVRKKYFDAWLNILQIVDLEPSILIPEQISLLNGYYFFSGYKPIVLIDIGRKSSNVIIYDREKDFFHMDIPIGGNDFINAIKDFYDIDWGQAEKLFVENRALNDGISIFKIIVPVIDNLIYEIKSALVFYENKHKDIEYKEIVLMGGASNIENLAWYLSYEIGIPTKKINFFKSFRYNLDEEKLMLINKKYALFSGIIGGLLQV